MTIAAVCVQCGKPKRNPLRACKACGYQPETEFQIARALMLSRRCTVGGVAVGRDAGVLKTVAARIQAGRPFLFDPKEEQQVVEAWRAQRAADDAARARRRKWMVVAVLVAAALASAWAWLHWRR